MGIFSGDPGRRHAVRHSSDEQCRPGDAPVPLPQELGVGDQIDRL